MAHGGGDDGGDDGGDVADGSAPDTQLTGINEQQNEKIEQLERA